MNVGAANVREINFEVGYVKTENLNFFKLNFDLTVSISNCINVTIVRTYMSNLKTSG